MPKELTSLIDSCSRCEVIDKPYVKFKVYEKWLPCQVKALIVMESPPPGLKKSFFYNTNSPDRLRRNLAFILRLARTGDEVIEWFRSRGLFITNAVKCRPLSRERVSIMAKNCKFILRREVELLKPEVIIAMGLTARRSIRALSLRSMVRIIELPHPNYIVRFRRDLIPHVRRIFHEVPSINSRSGKNIDIEGMHSGEGRRCSSDRSGACWPLSCAVLEKA
ncbi:MAG: hypothetical protein DRN15_07390 [Thermoprotei archaeon]|nr:MAG: hypothetical protein DRM97_05915 [Thermoprotei archaeon]RLF23042.1 MAG: hypothetical protein DRN15_07390 [Thermoprotei archaeon]